MVKSIKYIFTRIIIGVGIALILMLLKGGLIANVNALEVETFKTSDGSNFASCTNCNVINGAWSFNSGLKNVSGLLYMNIQVTTATANTGYMTTLVKTMVTIDGVQYNCNIQGYGNNFEVYNTGGIQHQISTYSLTCPVKFGDNGQFERIYIQANGSPADSISFYSPISFIYDNGNKEVVDAIQDNTDAQNETNDTLKDDSVDNDKAESDIDDMKDKVASNGSITQLLTLPITLYQAVFNELGHNGVCRSFDLGTLYNHNLILPCIDLENLLGSTLYNTIDILLCGLFILAFRKKMVDIFNHMTSLNDRGNELE